MALIERVGGAPSGAPESGALAGLIDAPEPLIRAVDSGECFLFAGEELARNSGMPVWSRYLAGLIDYLADNRAISREEANQLREIWKNDRYDRVAQFTRALEDGDRHASAYAARLYSKAAPLTKTLETLAKIHFCAAVTPNLDGLVERIMECESFGPSDALLVEDRMAESLPFVLKLRGLLGQPSLEVWQDVAIGQMHPDCAEALRELFRARTMLAVGISAEDLHRWLEAAGITHADRSHYLITTSERELKRKAETLYRKFHVRVLVDSDAENSELLPFLQKLAAHHKLSN